MKKRSDGYPLRPRRKTKKRSDGYSQQSARVFTSKNIESETLNKRPMHFDPDNFYHVYNRSFNKTLLFYNPANYRYFLKKVNSLAEYCDLLAYCLMPNHFHLLIYIDENAEAYTHLDDERDQGMHLLTRKIGTLQSSYTQAINKQEKRSGSLFQPKSKAKELEKGDQAFICFQYIHQNPFRAGLVSKMEDWQYSSFNEYYKGYDGICNKALARKLLGLPEDPVLFHQQAYDVIAGPPGNTRQTAGGNL